MRKIAILLLALFAIAGTSAARTHRRSNRVTRRANIPKGKRYRGKRTRVRRSSYEAPPRAQQGPSAERYQEIQQSLAANGYFKGEANGQWGPESVDALRRFQADQNLEVDGKAGSLSLIALGLGPKRTLNAQTKPAEPPPDQPAASQDRVPE
ncbi:MAG: peptidoglycan-binding domain-containing protein [Bryobacteraceae bacterium]